MPSKHEVTIKDIAKAANVSHTTVSRALSDSPLVIDETKIKIQEIAKQMGYVPNQIAKGLVTKSTKTIGLIIPNITNPFYPEVEEGIEEYANSLGFDVVICNSKMKQNREKISLTKLFSKRVDGIILGPVSDDISYVNEILPKSFPLVIVADQAHDNEHVCVYTDPVKCGFIAADYLIKIGHKRIAFVGGKEQSQITMGRLKGFRDALEANGLKESQELIRIGNEGQEAGYELTRQMLMNSILPTGIVSYNDVTALGVMQAVEDFGLKVPNSISVIGIDDISFSKIFRIELTTVRQDKQKLGQLATQLLIQKIMDPNQPCEQFNELEPNLIIRKSSAGII